MKFLILPTVLLVSLLCPAESLLGLLGGGTSNHLAQLQSIAGNAATPEAATSAINNYLALLSSLGISVPELVAKVRRRRSLPVGQGKAVLDEVAKKLPVSINTFALMTVLFILRNQTEAGIYVTGWLLKDILYDILVITVKGHAAVSIKTFALMANSISRCIIFSGEKMGKEFISKAMNPNGDQHKQFSFRFLVIGSVRTPEIEDQRPETTLMETTRFYAFYTATSSR
ncbi:hypothetical protein lerEdw1_009975 [Lerista edwardsae]|nr:hypothetical protein lerEdw1_009975 [Lerista edwardsae]